MYIRARVPMLRRILALLLAIVTVLSLIPSIPSVYADTGADYNGAGDGESSTSTSSAYTWNSKKMGLRISVVDSTGKPVTMNFNAIDIIWGDLPSETNLQKCDANKLQSIFDEDIELGNITLHNTEIDEKVGNSLKNSFPALYNYINSHDSLSWNIPKPAILQSDNTVISNQKNVYGYFINNSTLDNTAQNVTNNAPTKDEISNGTKDVIKKEINNNRGWNNWNSGGSGKPSGGGGGGSSSGGNSSGGGSSTKPVVPSPNHDPYVRGKMSDSEYSEALKNWNHRPDYTSGGVVNQRMTSIFSKLIAIYEAVYKQSRLTAYVWDKSGDWYTKFKTQASGVLADYKISNTSVKNGSFSIKQQKSLERYSSWIVTKMTSFMRDVDCYKKPGQVFLSPVSLMMAQSGNTWSGFLESKVYGSVYPVAAFIIDVADGGWNSTHNGKIALFEEEKYSVIDEDDPDDSRLVIPNYMMVTQDEMERAWEWGYSTTCSRFLYDENGLPLDNLPVTKEALYEAGEEALRTVMSEELGAETLAEMVLKILNSDIPSTNRDTVAKGFKKYEDMFAEYGRNNIFLQYLVDHPALIDKIIDIASEKIGYVFGTGEDTSVSGWDKDEERITGGGSAVIDGLSEDDMIGLIKYFLNIQESVPTKHTDYFFAFKDANPDEFQEYKNWLKSAYGDDGPGRDTPANRFQFFEYHLIIEPIVWFVPKKCHKSGGALYVDKTFSKYWMGTPSNWIEWANSHGWMNEYTMYSLRAGMANSLHLEKDAKFTSNTVKDRGSHQITGNEMAKSSDTNPMWDQLTVGNGGDLNGYGVNIINVGLPKIKLDETSTWNQTSRNPDGPQVWTYKGSGSSDPNDPESANKPGTGTPIDTNYKIIKYYELWEYDAAGNLISKLQPYDIPNSALSPYPYFNDYEPSKIYVEDEVPGNEKWKVRDWFTTKDVTKTTNTTYTQEYVANSYKQYTDFKLDVENLHTDNKSTGREAPYEMGTSGGDEERVLVVLLVQEKRPEIQAGEPEPGAGNITESQISKAITTNDRLGGSWGTYNFKSILNAIETSHAYDIHHPCPLGGCCDIPGTCNHIDRVAHGDHHIESTWTGLHTVTKIEVIGNTGAHKDFETITKSDDKEGKEITLATDRLTNGTMEWQLHSNYLIDRGMGYLTTIWRGPVDTLTLAKYKKEAMGADSWTRINSIVKADNKPIGARAENRNHMQDLNIILGVKSSDNYTNGTCDWCNCPSHHAAENRPMIVTTNSSTNEGNKVTLKAPITTEVYAGIPKTQAKAEVKEMKNFSVDYAAGVSTTSSHFVKIQTSSIDFYPYIRMTYQITKDAYTGDYSRENMASGNWDSNGDYYKSYLRDRTVFILSDNKSSILPTNSVEVSWFNKVQQSGKYGIHMTSQQWSVHKRATDGSVKWKVPNQVLPGGALYTLSTKDSETYIKTITYSTLVDDKSRDFMTVTDNSRYTINQVVDSNTNYINEAKDVIEHYRLAEWVNKDFNLEHPWDNTSTAVKILTGGEELTNLGLSLTASEDTKYNFQNGTVKNDALEGDIDILTETYTTTVYKCFTDTDGNVYIAAATSNPGQYQLTVDQLTKILSTIKTTNGTALSTTSVDGVSVELLKIGTKTQKLGTRDNPETGTILANLKNNQALNKFYVMNLKTGLVENVVNSIERNTGNDLNAPWAMKQDVTNGYTDGKWYNEANDGVYVVAQTATYKVGFGIPTRRVAALDPRLEPAHSSKGTIFNNAHLAQFRLDNKSTSAKAEGKAEGYVGTFDGIEVIMPDLENMYYSRPFYIPDASVSDLS